MTGPKRAPKSAAPKAAAAPPTPAATPAPAPAATPAPAAAPTPAAPPTPAAAPTPAAPPAAAAEAAVVVPAPPAKVAEPATPPPPPPPPPAKAAEPAPPPVTPPAPAAAPTPPPPPPPPAAPAGPSAMDRMRESIAHATEHLSRGEVLAAVGAAVILIVTWLFFGVLLGQFLLGTASELTVLLSLGVLGVVYLQARHSDQAGGSHDATDRHRTWLMLLSGAIAVLAIISAVELLRLAFNGQSNEQWLTRLSYWIGAAIAGAGGILIWRDRS